MQRQNRYVCSDCFTDPGLMRFVEENAVAGECSFCGAGGTEVVAARIEDVAEHFQESLKREYDLAVNQLGWDGAEGGYLGEHWDGFDLVTEVIELEFPHGNEWDLLPALFGELFDQDWCPETPTVWMMCNGPDTAGSISVE